MFPATILESILESTFDILTYDKPSYPSSGSIVWFVVKGVADLFCKFGAATGYNVPVIPRIETPSLMFPAVILESISDVTPLTITELKAS